MIKLSEISKFYGVGNTEVRALDKLSLEIERGEYLAITGQSGSGKSTLMNILGCLDTPCMGAYHFNGINTSLLTRKDLAYFRSRSIGFVFQSFNLIPGMTALENVMLPMLYKGTGQREAIKKAQTLIGRVGLCDRQSHEPAQLSGGQKQRVAIARALANEPQLLLADEPTGNLDSGTSKDIMEMFKTLNASGLTIIMITHDGESAHQANRILRIEDGRVV